MTATDRLRAELSRTPGAVTAVFEGYSTPALLDFDGSAWVTSGMAQVENEMISLQFLFGDLLGLAPGSLLLVGDLGYQVAQGPRRIGDGLMAVALLTEIPL